MPFYFLAALLFLLTLVTGPAGFGKITAKKTVYYAPPKVFEYFNFGQRESLADSFWLRLIQDLDRCEGATGSEQEIEISPEEKRKACNLSWGFRMFDLVTELAPRFRIPHAVGGLTLSVLLDDIEGAEAMFDKAVRNFPDDWPILYRASYFYFSDGNMPEKGAELALRAAKAGAPDWLNLSAARIYAEGGKKEMGIRILKEYKDSLTDENSKAIVQQKVDQLEASK